MAIQRNNLAIYKSFAQLLDPQIYVVEFLKDGFLVGYTKPYLIYQDLGVSGTKRVQEGSPFQYTTKQPPMESIKEWVRKKNIQGRDKKTGRFITRESIAYLIARSIKIRGLFAKNYFPQEEVAIEGMTAQLIDRELFAISNELDKFL